MTLFEKNMMYEGMKRPSIDLSRLTSKHMYRPWKINDTLRGMGFLISTDAQTQDLIGGRQYGDGIYKVAIYPVENPTASLMDDPEQVDDTGERHAMFAVLGVFHPSGGHKPPPANIGVLPDEFKQDKNYASWYTETDIILPKWAVEYVKKRLKL